jgi:hypothetical protein
LTVTIESQVCHLTNNREILGAGCPWNLKKPGKPGKKLLNQKKKKITCHLCFLSYEICPTIMKHTLKYSAEDSLSTIYLGAKVYLL